LNLARATAAAAAALACAAAATLAAPEEPRPASDAERAPPSAPSPAREPLPTAPALPPPLPPPALADEQGLAPESFPGDPLELLWGHRLDFSGGAPLVTIRLIEGQDEITFWPRATGRIEPRGGDRVRVEPGARLRARVRAARPATLSYRPLLAEFEARDRGGLDRARKTWEGRGVTTRVRASGGIYGIAGRVIDNRRNLLLAEGTWTQTSALAFAAGAFERFGERPRVQAEVVSKPKGEIEVFGADGAALARGDAVVVLETVEGGFFLAGVEKDPAQPGRGTEERAYRGRLLITVDSSGKLAAVSALPLEELLRGLVPSEMPAGSPTEALKAQAVTARSNVLAQIGTRHLADPWTLCSEVHCQAYRGDAAHAAATDAAVRATAGEALFGRDDRRLVDAVYSAMCGGHGEDNDAVWDTAPDPNLRGRPDLPPAAAAAWFGGLSSEERLRAFLDGAPQAWCARAPGSPPDRYRWERHISATEIDTLLASLGVGPVRALSVEGRGASGRARSLRVEGERGSASVRGELPIRRLLGNLPSAMFLLEREDRGWVLRGGGWGHGAGMCQWGAIGRAAAGQDYRQILRAYYSGAEVARIY
jgi:SpoIID/LytB domain protein